MRSGTGNPCCIWKRSDGGVIKQDYVSKTDYYYYWKWFPTKLIYGGKNYKVVGPEKWIKKPIHSVHIVLH